MRWKTVAGMLAAIGSVAMVIFYRHRRVDVAELGAVSEAWLAEHAPDRPE